MDARLDHVMFAWHDLDDVVDAFDRLGLSPEYGGVHGETATEMAMLGFEDGTYLECIAPTDPDAPPERWPEEMFAAGPCRWCLAAGDLRDELDRLREAGATVNGPEQRSRERPDGTRIEYEAAVYRTEEAAWPFPFLLRDLTPRDRRVQVSESVADGSLTGVETVVVAVEDLDASVERFRRLHGYPSPRRETGEAFGAALASFPDEPLTLAEPLDDGTWLADRLAEYPSWPCAFLLGSSDFDAAAAEYPLTGEFELFGSRVGWLDAPELRRRVGVVGR